ncbi:hypothetical protein ACPV30_04995 [Photobacterium damselae]|uniref:hypothetical protein n=1 Tax=Photobacterium damselae TaxID=38293 RepID=UPI004068505D
MMKKLLLFIFAVFLYGCGGGGDDDGGNTPKPIVDDIKAPLVQSRISQIDLFEQDMTVSLKKSIKDPQDLPVSLVSVKALTEGCPDPVFDQEKLTFDVVNNDLNYCAYQYTVKNHSSKAEYDKTASSISYIVMSETGQHSILDPLSASVTVGESLSIDLKNELGAQFPDDFYLQDDVYILGSGKVTTDITNSLVIYNADSVGITRLMYSLHNEITNETKIGYIDVAVSDVGNTMPEADDFAGPENVALNTEIEIDVNDPLHRHIRDLDGDPLQLTDVYVYNDEADVRVSSRMDFNNTKFIFSATKAGVYDVTYMIYDHKNGFAIGIVRITVEGPALPWHDITLLADGEYYTAPLDKNIADLYHVYYQSLGDYNLDGIDYEIPKFNYSSAETLCLSRGMILPTKDQLIKLSNSLEDEVINELGKWPTIDKFWTSDKGSVSGKHLAFLFDDKSISDDEDTSPYVVTCVAPGVLNLEVTRDGSCTTTSIDSKTCYDEITATVLHNNIPSENESVYLYSNDKSLFLNKTQGYTDVDGQVIFQIRSKDSGEHTVFVSYYSQRLEALLNFVLDTIVRYEVSPQNASINIGSSLDLSFKITRKSELEEVVTSETNWKVIEGGEFVSLTNNTVKGKNKGIATIEGTYFDSVEGKSFTDTSEITVKDPTEIVSTSLTPTSKNINIGDEYDLVFNANLVNGDTIRLYDDAEWSVDNEAIATVDSRGHVIGRGNGVAKFTVYPKKQPDDPSLVQTATVKVDDFVTNVILTPKDPNIDVGETLNMTLEAHYKSGKVDTISPDLVNWISKTPTVADIDINGIIKGISEGTSLITASFAGKEDTSTVTVNSIVRDLKITGPDEINIDLHTEKEDSIKLESVLNDTTTVTNNSSWSSSDERIATVNSDGTVVAYTTGNVVITASYDGLMAQHSVNVKSDDYSSIYGSVVKVSGCYDLAVAGEPKIQYYYYPSTEERGIPSSPKTNKDFTCKGKGLFPEQAIVLNTQNGDYYTNSAGILTEFKIDSDSTNTMERVFADGITVSKGYAIDDVVTGKKGFLGLKCIAPGIANLTSVKTGKKMQIHCS